MPPVAKVKKVVRGKTLPTYTLWRDLGERISEFLSNITLAELVNNQEVLTRSTVLTKLEVLLEVLIVADRQNNDSRCIDKRSSTREVIDVNLHA